MTTRPLDWIVILGSRLAPMAYGLEGRNVPTRVTNESLYIRYAGSRGAELNLNWSFLSGGSSVRGRPVVKHDEADRKRFRPGKDEKQHHSAHRRKDGDDFLVFLASILILDPELTF